MAAGGVVGMCCQRNHSDTGVLRNSSKRKKIEIVALGGASCLALPMPLPQSQVVNRRYFLRATGVSLALPLLESLSPRALGASKAVAASQKGAPVGATRPTRMVAIGNMLGF